MKWDIDEVRGAFSSTNNPGEQATVSKTFMTPSSDPQNLGGGARNQVSFADILTNHSVTALDQYRTVWKDEVQMKIKNNCNARLRIRMYVLIARMDQSGAGGLTLPENLWTEFNQEFDNPTRAITALDNTPYETPGWGRYWRIQKDIKFELGAGGSKDFKFVDVINKDMNRTELGQSIFGAAPYAVARGRTWAVMITHQGFPASDTTTPSNINTSPGTLSASWVWKCWSAPAEHIQVNTAVQIIAGAYGAMAGDGANFVVPASGLVSTFDAA